MTIDVSFLKNSCKLLLKKLNYKKDDYSINSVVLGDLCIFINKDLHRYNLTHKKTDEFDIASLVTFWFKKLKPLEPRKSQKMHIFINEIIGIYLSINILESVHKKKKIKNGEKNIEQYKKSKLYDYLSEHLDEFCFILRYRAVSPHVICYFLKTLYFFLNYTDYIVVVKPQSLQDPLVELLQKRDLHHLY